MAEDFQCPTILEGRESLEFALPIQVHSRPISRMSGDLAINTQDIIDLDETDLDHNLIAVARNLGLTIPEEPKEQPDPIQVTADNTSSVTVSSSYNESSLLPSRASNSTRPTSYNSTEAPVEPPIPSSTYKSPPSLTAPSMLSVATKTSQRSNSVFRKSIRRLSAFGRKKQNDPPPPKLESPPMQRANTTMSAFPSAYRPATSDGVRHQRFSASNVSILSAPPVLPQIGVIPRKAVGTLLPSYSESRGYGHTPSRRPLRPVVEEIDYEEIQAAKERSLRSSHLQRLRMSQLEDQSKVLKAHHEKLTTARNRYKFDRRQAEETHREKRVATIAKHETANADLETRHLSAEMELDRSLTVERKACETKIKYMEAYCYGKRVGKPPNPPGDSQMPDLPPRRRVTEDDYRKLVEAYHLRNGMDQLHRARIHVLREQQGAQVVRIATKQEAELDRIDKLHSVDMKGLKVEVERGERELKEEFEKKKAKLVWRWKVKESIERRRLELERGAVFGELPEVLWPEEEDEPLSVGIAKALSEGKRTSFLMS